MIAISSVTLAAAFLTLFLIVRRVMTAGGQLPLDSEWIGELSAERYRPMTHLLDEREVERLRIEPGYTPEMETQLRLERCQAFREYLGDLEADFQRVCTAVKLLMLQAQYDRPDLATVLVRHQASFAVGMATVNVRLFCYRHGICAVDVSGLVKTFEAMRLELRSLTPAVATAGF
jgi:hypothetical protein